MASVAKRYNVFIGVALDDDITDADGINSAIARTYTIDYLDQEHLYQIVDTHIFPKHRQTRGLIQNLYQKFRETLPNFRWSEQRFNSLYPLHPSILEVAPFVRFYAPSFALLGFASTAGAKILGRPANSLISLDEVFDNVESTLRKSSELEDSFQVYDRIRNEVISEIPVMQRLQAKLILKALFILSLDGNGTSAGEIAEALLIFDETNSKKSTDAITELLDTFANAVPDGIWKRDEEGRDSRFSFKISGKDDLNTELEDAAKDVSKEVIPRVLQRLAKDKFKDWELFAEENDSPVESMPIRFLWNGSYRNARVFWKWDEPIQELPSESESDDLDITIFINTLNNEPPKEVADKAEHLVLWNAALLTGEEITTLKRLHVLLNDTSLKDKFGEQVRASGHTHMGAAQDIWDRVFLGDARIAVNDKRLELPDDLRDRELYSDVVSDVLAPHFAEEFPQHPEFEAALGMEQVSTLVNDLFSGARVKVAEVQELAETYALPLGLVRVTDDEFALEREEALANAEIAKTVLSEVESAAEEETVSLKTIYEKLREKPYGLSREAQNLVLGALVARRHIEFVTSTGDRINHRSLDLKILWEDIVGIGRPASVEFDYQTLNGWVQAITGVDDLEPFDSKSGRANAIEALSDWYDQWQESGVIERFNELPDEILNTRIWHISTRVEKTFGVVARTVKSMVDEVATLEEGLQRVAETFFDSAEEFVERKVDLHDLEDFVVGAQKREHIWSYLAICETTQDESIEKFRMNLLRLIDESYDLPSLELNQQMDEAWQSFHQKYSEHFAVRHNAIMNSQQLKQEFDKILKSDEWWEFECLSKLPIFKDLHWLKAQRILSRFKDLECGFDVKENLKTHPFCACAFSLTKMNELAKLSHSLSQTISVGRNSYRKTLYLISDFVITQVESIVENDEDESLKKEVAGLVDLLKKEKTDAFSSAQLSILYSAMFSVPTSTSIDIDFPDESGLYTSEELQARLNAWFDDLPNEPILLKI